jgi:hypothetical protein
MGGVIYTSLMRLWVRSSLLLGVALFSFNLMGVEKQYQAGKIVDLQQKANTKVLYYIANTPVTKDEPYYEITLESGNLQFVGRYTPRHADDTLPVDWVPGGTVDFRTDSHHLYLKKYSGTEVTFATVKRSSVTKPGPNAEPTSSKK